LKGYIDGEIKPVVQDMQRRSNTGKYYEYMEIDWENDYHLQVVFRVEGQGQHLVYSEKKR
jgi:hypothetical protein